MFSNPGLPPTSDQQAVSDDLVELGISGNEATLAARFTELLAAGLDDLTVSLAPTADAVDDDEQARLTHSIGRL